MCCVSCVITEHLLNDGGHEEGDGDHGGGQQDDGQRCAGHHETGGAPVSLLPLTHEHERMTYSPHFSYLFLSCFQLFPRFIVVVTG